MVAGHVVALEADTLVGLAPSWCGGCCCIMVANGNQISKLCREANSSRVFSVIKLIHINTSAIPLLAVMVANEVHPQRCGVSNSEKADVLCPHSSGANKPE